MKWLILTVIITLILTLNVAFAGGDRHQGKKDRSNIEQSKKNDPN